MTQMTPTQIEAHKREMMAQDNIPVERQQSDAEIAARAADQERQVKGDMATIRATYQPKR